MSDDGKAFTLAPGFQDIGSFISLIHNINLPYNLNFIATIIPAFKADPTYKYANYLVGNDSGI